MPEVIFAEGCREMDIRGTRHYARGGQKGYEQGGLFRMPDASAKLAVQAGGAIASLAGATRRGIGFRCPACRFGSWTKACGRCGSECERE